LISSASLFSKPFRSSEQQAHMHALAPMREPVHRRAARALTDRSHGRQPRKDRNEDHPAHPTRALARQPGPPGGRRLSFRMAVVGKRLHRRGPMALGKIVLLSSELRGFPPSHEISDLGPTGLPTPWTTAHTGPSARTRLPVGLVICSRTRIIWARRHL